MDCLRKYVIMLLVSNKIKEIEARHTFFTNQSPDLDLEMVENVREPV